MDDKDMSDSDESDGEYVPLHKRLGLSGSAGSSIAEPISLDSSEDEDDASSQRKRFSAELDSDSRPTYTASCSSPPTYLPSYPSPLHSLRSSSPLSPSLPSSPSPPRPRLTGSDSASPLSQASGRSTSSSAATLAAAAAKRRQLQDKENAKRDKEEAKRDKENAKRDKENAKRDRETVKVQREEAKLQREEAKRQREEAKLQREAAKRQKEVEKRLRQAEAAAKRSARPEHCQKSLHVLVDRRLLELDGGGLLLAALQASDVTVHVTDRPQPGTVTWERDVTQCAERHGQIVTSTTREPEDHIVAVYDAETLASLVEQQMADASGGLSAAILDLGESTGKNVTVLCWGLDKFCRTKTMAGSYKQAERAENGGKKRKRALKLDRLQLESVLVDTLVDTPHNVRLVNTPEDGGQFLAQMSKAIAEAPFKRDRSAAAFSWCADADASRPVKVDRQLRGLRRLWTEQLRQLPGGSLETAQAVSAVYPSPQALIKAYGACSSEAECVSLVADLPIRRTVGPLVSSRRVGNEMSRKLYLVMTTTDGSTEL